MARGGRCVERKPSSIAGVAVDALVDDAAALPGHALDLEASAQQGPGVMAARISVPLRPQPRERTGDTRWSLMAV
jgi:hypothetical protein